MDICGRCGLVDLLVLYCMSVSIFGVELTGGVEESGSAGIDCLIGSSREFWGRMRTERRVLNKLLSNQARVVDVLFCLGIGI